MPKYTIYVVSRNRDHHYPVIIASNGKAAFNEPVKRAAKLAASLDRFLAAVYDGDAVLVRITEKDFKAKFPNYAPNKGGKRKAPVVKKPATKTFKVGDVVIVNAGLWGNVKGVVNGKGKTPNSYALTISAGRHKGKEGVWLSDDITKA